MHTQEQLAEKAYAAHCKSTGGMDVTGHQCVLWPDLPTPQRKAWLDAVQAIATEIAKPFTSEHVKEEADPKKAKAHSHAGR
jgi:hypothetical protein